MMRNWKYLSFFILGGVLLAVHLSPWLLPARHRLVPLGKYDQWITTRNSSMRGYFRQVWRMGFKPEHAWISIAADEYQLYVNGVRIGRNIRLTDAGNAFQAKLTAQSQSLTHQQVFNVLRDPTWSCLKARANEEWQMVQFYDIGKQLKPGRNVVAVYAQADHPDRLAVTVRGAASAGPVVAELSPEAPAWRTTIEGSTRGGRYWFEAGFNDFDWQEARPHGPPGAGTMFAVATPAIWCEPFTAPAITCPIHADEAIFRTMLPAGKAGQSGTLRVRGSWHYQVFLGESWVGEGEGPGLVNAFDISQYLGGRPRQLTVRMYRRHPQDVPPPSAGVPWLAADARIGSARLCTGPGWHYLASFHPAWLNGGGEWVPAAAHWMTQPPSRIDFNPPNPRDRHWFLRFARTALLLAGLLAAAAWLLLKVLPAFLGWPKSMGGRLACWALSPALFGIFLLEVLQFRFGESDTLLFFLAPSQARLLVLTGPVLFLLTVILLPRPRSSPPSRNGDSSHDWRDPVPASGLLHRAPPLRWLTLIALLGLVLRVYGLDFQPTQTDEDVSWDAIRGILRTGTPETASSILYTRSPLYHYAAAAWLTVFGDTLSAGRYFSLLPGLAMIPLGYYLVSALSGRRYLGLLAALILAVDPWQLGSSNLLRFYQQWQFFTVLSVLLFLKGFLWRQGRGYQNLFFVCATAGVLSQEIFVSILPAFLLGFLVWYRPFHWREDRNIWLGFLTMIIVCLHDLAAFKILCMTPHAAVATNDAGPIQIHFTDITSFTTLFFWMHNGATFFFSAFFFAGAFYWIRSQQRAMHFLYMTIVVTVAVLTVIVVPIAPRYVFGIYPLLVAAAVISADALLRAATAALWPGHDAGARRLRRRWATLVAAVTCAALLVQFEPWKILDSDQRVRFIDHRGALAYIARHRRPGDKVGTVRPGTGATVLGGTDYYFMVLPHFDELFLRKNELVDRWAGGKLVWKIDHVRQAFRTNKRVWIVVDDSRLQPMSSPLAEYLFQHCTVEYQFFGGQVLLWDRKKGRFATFPDQGAQPIRFRNDPPLHLGVRSPWADHFLGEG